MKKNKFNINTTILSLGIFFFFIGIYGYEYVCDILSIEVVLKYKYMLILLGLLMILYYIDQHSTFDRIFRKTNLGIDGVYPIKKSKTKNYDSTIYRFSLPTGLCTEDIIKKQQHIQEYLNKKIEISYDSKRTFKIIVYDEHL